jgi:UDP-2,3-diacylglucosamine pyrophosphatase LpxH
VSKRLPDFPAGVFELYDELRSDPTTNKFKIGVAIAEAFEPLFEGYRPRSVCEAVRRQAQERGIALVQSRPGGRPRVKDAHTLWLDRTPELVIPYSDSVIVISDVHAGQHSSEALSRALDVIEAREIETVIWNGDLFDNAYKGHSGLRSKYAQSFDDGCETVADIVTAVHSCPSVEQSVFLCGNHDDKTFRDTDREFEFEDLLTVALNGVPMPPTVHTTNRYYAIMEPKEPAAWPFTGPENFPWMFTHQKEYGRNQLSVAKRLVDVEFANTVCGHQHHLAVGKHPNGLVYLVDAGTLQDPRLPAYKNARQTTHPKWAVGFATITHGVPEIWDLSNPEEWWEERL